VDLAVVAVVGQGERWIVEGELLDLVLTVLDKTVNLI